ncbi:protein O-mannose kinase-like isoform X1 [Hydra vulgaris]|uniref:protein O-mannose kinase-like isoform X1 n=1 Tax=Hydra vulgaris TaxID=6087 RepID=UPI001F5FA021|nr:protein O-mannose kinase-like [Hydra vulgaris]
MLYDSKKQKISFQIWHRFFILALFIFFKPCVLKCQRDEFVKEDGSCQTLFFCTDVALGKELTTAGYVKRIYHAELMNINVVVSFPRFNFLKEDFLHGLTMLKEFHGSPNVIELIGYCNRLDNLQLITRYWKYGSADNLDFVLSHLKMSSDDEFRARLNIVLDYVNIIAFLHNSPLGTRVMCDSNTLNKTLSQYLITDELRLVVNDLDALPEVHRDNQYKIKCGNRQLFGDFVAPEQLWPYENRPFDDNEMVGYNEKIDIWKIPSVLLALLGNSLSSTQLKLHFFNLFFRCRSHDPAKRPSAMEVQNEIQQLINRKVSLKTEF